MKTKAIVISVTVIAIMIAIIISRPFDLDLSYTLSLLSQPVNILILVIAIILQFCGHYFRATKQSLILQQIRSVKTIEVFKGQMIGSLFNTILPLRLGEFVKANYIARGVSISRSAVFATILFERLLDVFVLLLLGTILLLVGMGDMTVLRDILTVLGAGFIVLGFILYSARSQQPWVLRFVFDTSRLFNNTVRDRLRMIAWSAIYGLKNTITRHILPRYLLLTIIMWFFYLASISLFAGLLFDMFFSIDELRLGIASYLGVSIPSGPAYLGSFQTIFTALSGVSIQVLHDYNVTLLLWLLLVLPVSVTGVYYLLQPQKIYNSNPKHKIVSVLKNKLYRDLDITKEFSHFLDAYFGGSQINRILTNEEHANHFQTIKTFKGGSNALTLLAWQNGKMVVKKITLREYRDKLKAQHDWLVSRKHLPQIAGIVGESDNHPDYYSIDIEYQDEYIPFFDFIHSSSSKTNKQILNDVCSFVAKKIYSKPSTKKKNGKSLLNKYIRDKVVGKVTDAANINTPISKLLAHESIVVNGRTLKNFNTIIDEITSNSQAMKDLSDIIESPIHGDLTVDNIIVNPKNNKFIILDPNNENAISDPVVDYGKLMQSVHSGYEFLVSLSECKVRDNIVSFEENRSVRYQTLYRELSNHLALNLTPERHRTVLFHEAVHYCRMLTYRCDINPKTAAIFYSVAIRLFNEFLDQYDDTKKA